MRYDELYKIKISIVKDISAFKKMPPTSKDISSTKARIELEIESYHRRYWGLKSDQIDYWLAGYVDPETLISWFMSTIDFVHDATPGWTFGDITKLGGWESVRDFHETTNHRMFEIGEEISRINYKNMNSKEKYGKLFNKFNVIEHDEPSLIRMLSRNTHRRLTMKLFYERLQSSTKEYATNDL
ncbi:hypothetical protein PQ455_03370 [Sphingomonas naphthae]|uniref:Uncharacterized protein n=1 Tax=Sphingomonas naphthae TaxID=1813468 RepID=A0ABY7TM18_9SPHN|nr:hypothetical protein [Sphingomonas naphthae]WCT74281.1 hypothetical protein PQ455_03370 [Sphingomonas naphthae]